MIPPSVYQWFRASVVEHFARWWPKTAIVDDREIPGDELLDLWLRHMIAHDFAKIFISSSFESPLGVGVVQDLGQLFASAIEDPNVTKGYLLARPVRMGWVFDTELDYFKTMFAYDPAGEVVWIDSLWAKGLYDKVLAFLRSTQKPYVAWVHKNRLYFKVIRELTDVVPIRHEIEEGFVRAIVPP